VGNRTNKIVRKTTKAVLGDRLDDLLKAMLDAPLRVRLRYALIIVLRLGRKGL
jgi:hypothetical protein